MNRAEYEAGRSVFRLLCALRGQANVRPGIVPRMPRIAREYGRLMMRQGCIDPLAVPLVTRLYWFRMSRDAIQF